MPLAELKHLRSVFGNDKHAINRHSQRTYVDRHARRWFLDKTLDALPPFYAAYGPIREGYQGVCYQLKVKGEGYWGSGIGWTSAVHLFLCAVEQALNAEHHRTTEEAPWKPPFTI